MTHDVQVEIIPQQGSLGSLSVKIGERTIAVRLARAEYEAIREALKEIAPEDRVAMERTNDELAGIAKSPTSSVRPAQKDEGGPQETEQTEQTESEEQSEPVEGPTRERERYY